MRIKDISRDTDYERVVTQGFMGGSLIYNESDISLGQLSDGVSVAIRLSQAKATDVGDNQTVFGEVENSAEYGLLIVNSINSDIISFTVRIYNTEGTSYSETTHSLYEGQSVDINGDGKVDLQYKIPSQKRSGYEKAVYLNFVSSQEELNISMYAVLTEQYPGNSYPNGIIGVNPNGRFLVAKYTDSAGTARSVVRGMYKGDYVIDSVQGKYQKVISNRNARSARAVADDDLQDMEDTFEDTNFYFTEADFAFIEPKDLLDELPTIITSKYTNYTDIDKLNKILEDPELMLIVDENQGSVLPADTKEEIFGQFANLHIEEIIQLNRVFLEKNYQFVCPQRVTVSDFMLEIFPLASVCITSNDVQPGTDSSNNENSNNSDSSRAASASWSGAKNKEDYDDKLGCLEERFKEYKAIPDASLTEEKLKNIFHDEKKKEKNSIGVIETDIGLNNSKVAVGIKGTFNITWTSVSASLGAAVFIKAGTDISINVKPHFLVDPSLNNDNEEEYVYEYDEEGNLVYEQEEDGSFKYDNEGKKIPKKYVNDVRTLPIIKITKKLWDYNKTQSYNLLHFFIGPILITISLDTGIGIPIDLFVEANTSVKYDVYIAGLVEAGVSASFGYGIRWEKVWWFIKKPVFYGYSNSDAYANADAIYYVDTTGDSFNLNLNSLETGISISPYAKAEISLNVAAVVHGGFGVKSGVTGKIGFKYEKDKLSIVGKYSLNYNNDLYANVFLGFKNVKILWFDIGDLGFGKTWHLLEKYPKLASGVIIPETVFYEQKLY